MRIVAGQLRGRTLFFPKDKQFRPTQDRPKEALFSILQPYLEQKRVLDLFCGTGSLGLEALSRGCAHVTFVDTETSYLKRNLALFPELSSHITVFQRSVYSCWKHVTGPFDLIFMDPPWHESDRGRKYYDEALLAIAEFAILAPLGTVVCEHHCSVIFRDTDLFQVSQTRRYSDTRLTFFQQKETILDQKSDLSR